MMVWNLLSVLPARKRAPVSAGLFWACGRRPLAFELTRPVQDRVFEIGLDLPRDGGFEPVAVTEPCLAGYRHRYRIGPQRSRQDEHVDLVALVRLPRRRIPIGDHRSGQRVLRGQLDEIEGVEGGLPQNRADGAPGLRADTPFRFLLGETKDRPDRRFGID